MYRDDLVCSRCGSSYVLAEKGPGFEKFVCDKCGEEIFHGVSRPLQDVISRVGPSFEVVVVWPESPTARDLALLRGEVEYLQDSTITDLKAKVTGMEFSLGWHSEKDARKTIGELSSVGLSVQMRKRVFDSDR